MSNKTPIYKQSKSILRAKYIHFFLVGALTLCVPHQAHAAPPSTPLETETLDRIAAVVNDDIITESQLQAAIHQAHFALASSGATLPSPAALSSQVLRQLIDEQLQLQVAKNLSIEISPSQVSEAVSHIAEQNHLSVLELKQKIEEGGVSFGSYREEIKKQMTLEMVHKQSIPKDLTVSSEEVQSAKQRVHGSPAHMEYNVADIFIELPENPTTDEKQAALKKAGVIFNQLQHGVHFKQLAATYSQGTNPLRGGDLGWRTLEQLPAIFADPLQKMIPGQYSQLITAPNGVHILNLLNVRGQSAPVSEEQIRTALFQRKVQEYLQTWLSNLRRNAYIKINNGGE